MKALLSDKQMRELDHIYEWFLPRKDDPLLQYSDEQILAEFELIKKKESKLSYQQRCNVAFRHAGITGLENTIKGLEQAEL